MNQFGRASENYATHANTTSLPKYQSCSSHILSEKDILSANIMGRSNPHRQQEDILLSSDGSDVNQSENRDIANILSGANYYKKLSSHPKSQFHDLRSSSNEEINSDGDNPYPTMMQQSLDVISHNLNRLTNELNGSSSLSNKRRKIVAGSATGITSCYQFDELALFDRDGIMQRKRKIPQSFQLYQKNPRQAFDQECSQHWTTILRTQILDESKNDSFKERRKELL